MADLESKEQTAAQVNGQKTVIPAQLPEDTGQQTIENLTAKRLRITGKDDRLLVLAPFEKGRELSKEELAQFPNLWHLEMQNFVRVLGAEKAEDFLTQFKTLFSGTLVVAGFITFMVHTFLSKGGDQAVDPKLFRTVLVVIAALFLVAIALEALLLRNWNKGEFLQSVLLGIAQALSLFLILALAIGLPTFAFYFFGGGREVFGGQTPLAKLGRTLQLIFIFTASLLPALLYFLFDRHQLRTLRQKFEQQIFRLDPNIESLRDVWAKYGKQIDEIYGRESAKGEGRLVRGTRWPILVATLVITLGWMLTLLPAGSQATQLIEFFVPQPSAVTFGFLGAYFFVLNTVLRRYIRADLKPKAYSSITVRIFVVIILAWVLPFKGNNPYELMTVFLIGVFPESGLTLIRESIRKQTGLGNKIVGFFVPRTKERYPLTELEEIDVYDRARLLDEGVTNIESLAHHDLIDLMLETRIPVARLVDWVDQAILYLHLEFDPGDKDPGDYDPGDKERAGAGNLTGANELRKLRNWLRTNCIRTATDFKAAYADGKGPLQDKADSDQKSRLKVLLATLQDDEWLDYIDHWRNSKDVMVKELDASGDKKQTNLADDLDHSARLTMPVIARESDSETGPNGDV